LHFESLKEFCDFAQGRDLHVYGSGFNAFVADHPIDPEQLRSFRWCDLGKPAWRGIAVVNPWTSASECPIVIIPETVDRPYRTWGNLLAAGDEDLLDRIERFCREE